MTILTVVEQWIASKSLQIVPVKKDDPSQTTLNAFQVRKTTIQAFHESFAQEPIIHITARFSLFKLACLCLQTLRLACLFLPAHP